VSEQSEALKERALAFGVRILQLVDRFPRTVVALTVARQLAKSATSIGANYCAACNARSRPEFAAKPYIVNEESAETVHWLTVVSRASYAADRELEALQAEAVQLTAISGRSLATARTHLRNASGQMTK
jgi:four helix bundle protein